MKRNVDLTENQQFSRNVLLFLENIDNLKRIIELDLDEFEGRPDNIFGWKLVWCNNSYEMQDIEKYYCPCCGKFIEPWYINDEYDAPLDCPHCHYHTDELQTNYPWGIQNSMRSNKDIFDL